MTDDKVPLFAHPIPCFIKLRFSKNYKMLCLMNTEDDCNLETVHEFVFIVDKLRVQVPHGERINLFFLQQIEEKGKS